MTRERALPPLAFATCCLIWGSTYLVIRIGNESLPPLWACSLRLALATVLLLLLARLSGQPLPRGAALRSAVEFGFVQFGIGFSLLYWGETIVSSGLTAVLFGTIPLATALFAGAFGLERIGTRKLAAALIGIAGVTAIFLGQLSARVPLLPLLAVLVSATAGALSGVLLKRGPRQAPFALNAVACAAGLPMCLALSFLLRESHALPRGAAWFPLLYLTVVGSVGAYVAFSWLIQRWEATRVSFIAVVVPVVAVILGALVRHETLTLASLLGSLLVLGGVFLGLLPARPAAAAGRTAPG